MSTRLGKAAWLALVTSLAVAAGTAAPAGAADPPCNGMFATDPTGDAVIQEDSFGLSAEEPGTDNMDLTGMWLNFRNGALTVHFQVKNLTKEIPEHSSTTGGIYYYAYFTDPAGDVRFVKAQLNPDGNVTYHYGTVFNGVAFIFYITDGDTTGAFEEGPNGVVSIQIPADLGGTAGSTLGGLFGVIDTIEGEDDFTGINHHADSHIEEPDTGAPNGRDYAVVECPAGAAPPPSGGGEQPPPPGGGEQPPPPPSGGEQPLTELPFKAASSTLGSAKKAKKRRSLSFRATAERTIENLRVTLRKGSRSLGSATIASFPEGTRTLKLKVSRKIKKGKYTLAATGTVDGRSLSTSQAVKLRK